VSRVWAGHSITLDRTILARPEDVFDAWTRPEHLRRWACPEGATIEDARVDLRVGGRFHIKMRGQEGETYTAFGAYRSVQPPRRLVYTWDWEEQEHQVGETLVEVEFRDHDGGTRVVLTHSGFPSQEAAGGHEQGWTSCFDKLSTLVAR
jgi:uncharacterized protein YndB with AHSA1/START domain